jgi:hypothetical protein
MITYKRLIELFHYDPYTGIFYRKKLTSNFVKINSKVGTKNCYGYIQMYVDRKLYRAHRLAWLYMMGVMPKNDIDHINRIRDDNRFLNLREANKKENAYNTKVNSTNTTGFKGVSKANKDGKYPANIRINGKVTFLGLFSNPLDASIAYKNKAKEIHGNFYAD